MEKKIGFVSGALRLEGLCERKTGGRGVLVTHPHPLYGGEMTNPVVESVAAAFSSKGYSTLRFNFRGVGGSEGSYDNGRGEQDDVLAAADYFYKQGINSIHLVGYSFGAWILGQMDRYPAFVDGMTFISPPLALLPFPPRLQLPLLNLVITGEEDEIAPPQLVEPAVAGWNEKAQFACIEGADHFYFGSFRELESRIGDFLASLHSL